MKAQCEEHMKTQKELIILRMKKLESKKKEIQKKASTIRDNIEKKYVEMKRVLEEDRRVTLSLLEMEEKATVQAVDELIQKNVIFLSDTELQPSHRAEEQVEDLLKNTDPGFIKLDEVKAEQILDLTNNLLLFIRSQTPTAKRILKSCLTEASLDPSTAHPKLIISSAGDCATFTHGWQDVPEHKGRFDTTLNVLSVQSWDSGRHYWELEVRGKVYWELGLTYPTIPRKGRRDDCWLGRRAESWCVEFFDGCYTAWHGGKDHLLPICTHCSRIGVFCSFPAGLIVFLAEDSMTPLFAFCVGSFKDSLHLAVCPGHDLQGSNQLKSAMPYESPVKSDCTSDNAGKMMLSS